MHSAVKPALLVFADDLPRRRPPQIYKPPTAEMIAYLDFSVSTTGMLTGVKVRHVTFYMTPLLTGAFTGWILPHEKDCKNTEFCHGAILNQILASILWSFFNFVLAVS